MQGEGLHDGWKAGEDPKRSLGTSHLMRTKLGIHCTFSFVVWLTSQEDERKTPPPRCRKTHLTMSSVKQSKSTWGGENAESRALQGSQIPPLPFASCEGLRMSPALSESQSPYLQNGNGRSTWSCYEVNNAITVVRAAPSTRRPSASDFSQLSRGNKLLLSPAHASLLGWRTC